MAGKSYPAGSYVVKAAQAFRPHLRDMFEPQDHPNDFLYPGGPPRPPYDVTGYTLAFQMGVQFDRMLEPFDGPFEKLPLKPIATRRRQGRGAGQGRGRRLPAEPPADRRVHGDDEAAGREGRRVLAEGAVHRGRQDLRGRHDLHPGEADDEGAGREAGRPSSASGSTRPPSSPRARR